MGGDNVVITSNLNVRTDGLPLAKQKKVDDPGVAVYFLYAGKPYVLAHDRYHAVEENAWGIAKHIERYRLIIKEGVVSAEELLHGSQLQLQAPYEKTWYEYLGWSDGLCSSDVVETAFRKLKAKLHPDTPEGDEEKFKECQMYYELWTKSNQ